MSVERGGVAVIGLVGLAVLLSMPLAAHAQECWAWEYCPAEETHKCVEKHEGWEFVSGGTNCPTAEEYPCDEYPRGSGPNCPPDPTPEASEAAELEATLAWQESRIQHISFGGEPILLFAEVPADYPPADVMLSYVASLRAECQLRKALLTNVSVTDR